MAKDPELTNFDLLDGMGRAPFMLNACDDNPGNCDLCGQRIRWRYRVRSAGGSEFVLGGECAIKVWPWRKSLIKDRNC